MSQRRQHHACGLVTDQLTGQPRYVVVAGGYSGLYTSGYYKSAEMLDLETMEWRDAGRQNYYYGMTVTRTRSSVSSSEPTS